MSATAYDAEAVTTERSADKDDAVPADGLREGDEVRATHRTRLDEERTITGTVAYGGRDTYPSSGGLRGHRVAIDTGDETVTLWTGSFGDGRFLEMQDDEGHDAEIEIVGDD